MIQVLVLLGIAAGVGFALYCMVCETVESNRARRATATVEASDTAVPKPMGVDAQAAPSAATR